jgi:hypothetical protein
MPLRFSPARNASVLISASSRGPTGAAATITVGTVTTLGSTASATVTNSGTSAAAVFNFGIPQGVAGSGNVTASSTFAADNLLVRTDGVSRDIQGSLVSVDDTGNVSPTVSGAASLGTTSLPWLNLNLANAGVVNFNNGDVTITHSTNALSFSGSTGYVFDAKIVPATNNAVPLGDLTHSYTGLFLGSGGAIDFNAGDVTITHSTNSLSFAGSTGYVFDNKIAPAANDGAALGDATHAFSDLFLANGAVVNFSNSDVTITHSTNALTITGGVTALDADSTVGSAKIVTVGKQTICIPAGAMASAAVNGAESGTFIASTNAANIKTLAFDTTTEEYAHFHFDFPNNWDEGVVTYRVSWTSTLGSSDGVAWGLDAYAASDNENLDTAYGTEVLVTDDVQGTANRKLTTSESASLTIGNTPAAGDTCFFRVKRKVGDANDDLATDARLIDIALFYNTNAPTDA